MKAFSQKIMVTDEQTAVKMGSGSLSVFATPALVACMENTACKLLSGELTDENTTVGILINVEHLKASAVGEEITIEAVLTQVDGRKYIFEITAKDSSGSVVGKAVHERFLVNKEKFMSKIQK